MSETVPARTKQRNIAFDTARGIACILLVLYHVIGDSPRNGLRIPEGDALWWFNQGLGYFRMPMFSVLSGIVYAARPYGGNYPSFAMGKFRRLIVPMLIVGTIFAIVQAVTPGVNTRPPNWYTLHLLPVSHYWFLESMFTIFLLMPLVERWVTPRGSSALIVLIAVLVLICAAGTFETIQWFSIRRTFYLAPYFLAGVWMHRFGMREPVWPYVAAMVVLVALLIGDGMQQGTLPDRFDATATLASGAFCLAVIRYGWRNSTLAAIGVYSFSIYLFHSFFTAASRIVQERLFGAHASVVAMIVVGLIVGVVGPIVLHRFLVRYRWGRIAIGEREPKAKAPAATPLQAGGPA